MTMFLRNNFFGRLAESDLDRDGHFIRQGRLTWVQSDDHDFVPVSQRVKGRAGFQTDRNIRWTTSEAILGTPIFQSDLCQNYSTFFVDQIDWILCILSLARNLHLKMERTNLWPCIAGFHIEAWRADRLANVQKSLEVSDGPFESDDTELSKEAFPIDDFGNDVTKDVWLRFDLRRHFSPFWLAELDWKQIERSINGNFTSIVKEVFSNI